jgi:hypothetical protein
MTSKSPVRSAEDVDEQALSYAEIKALATGNPLIIEKCNLEMEVGKLNLIKSSFLSQKYALEDKILKHYPAEIKRLGERIEGYTADIMTTMATKPVDKDGFEMKIGDTLHTEKKSAGSAILQECQAMSSPAPVSLGSYRGFDMELSFDSFNKVYDIALKGELTHSISLGTDVFGNITRLDNLLDGMDSKLKTCVENLESTKSQLVTAKAEVEKPFPQESELNDKSIRLNEINIALNLDKRENEIVGSSPDEGDVMETPQKKDRGYER